MISSKGKFYWTDINQSKPKTEYLIVSNGSLTDVAFWIRKEKRFEDSLAYGLTHDEIRYYAKMPTVVK